MIRNAALIAIIKIALLCLVVVSGIGLILLFWIIPGQVRTPEVAVPNLVGQSYQHAVQLIHSAGLQLDADVEKKPSPDVPEGYVIQQAPPANFSVKLNKPVRLTVSLGNETVAVPDVTGKPLNEAETALKSAGFWRGRAGAVHSDRYPQMNTVIAQTPQAGVMYRRGGSVDLLLSLGVRPKVLQLPDLRRMPINEARSLLESNGLIVGQEVVKPHPEINEGLIIAQQPAAGALISVGQVVNLEVSGSHRSQVDKGHTIQIKYRVSPAGKPFKQVRIIVTDEREQRIEVVNDSFQSGTLIDEPPLRVFGKAKMLVYEDNQLIKTEEFD